MWLPQNTWIQMQIQANMTPLYINSSLVNVPLKILYVLAGLLKKYLHHVILKISFESDTL